LFFLFFFFFFFLFFLALNQSRPTIFPHALPVEFPLFFICLSCLRSVDFFFWCGQHTKRLNWHSEVSERPGQVALVVVPHFRLLFKLAKNSPSWLRIPLIDEALKAGRNLNLAVFFFKATNDRRGIGRKGRKSWRTFFYLIVR
jgi:hypothetical protein